MNMKKAPRLIRITTVPVSLLLLLKGQMKYMQQNGFEVIMVSSPGNEAALAEEQEMCAMITLPMQRGVHLIKDVITLIRLYKLLKELKPDIVHTHTPKAGLLGMLASMFCKVPVRLHTIAGLPWMEHKGISRFILKQTERITGFSAHRIYPNSKGLKQFIEQQLIIPKQKLKLLGNGSSNGIDCMHFSPAVIPKDKIVQLQKKAKLTANGFVWLFVGRLVKDKGITELVNAFIKITAEFPEDQLWLVGKEEPDLDPIAQETSIVLKNNSAVKCWGFQKDVRPFLAASSVLVFPSYREGFPNVPMQAGAMEKPMILSNINGCNEIVEHGVSGILVKPKSTDDLYYAMRLLRRDAGLCTTLGVNSRRHIVKYYSQQTIWKQLRTEYVSLLQENKRN